jgi:hypothetical protein
MKRENMVSITVDQLGLTKADIKVLEDRESVLKADLIHAAAHGTLEEVVSKPRQFDGRLYRATVSFVDRSYVAHEAVYNELINEHGVDRALVGRLIRKYTETVHGLPVVRVTSL